MAHERAGHILQPTALVNEAYLRLVDVRRVRWNDRAHFFAMAARLMRRILVDDARARGYQKRGGGRQQVTLDDQAFGSDDSRQISWRWTTRSRRWRRLTSVEAGSSSCGSSVV